MKVAGINCKCGEVLSWEGKAFGMHSEMCSLAAVRRI